MNPALLAFSFMVVAGLVRGDDLQLLSSATSGFSQALYQQIALDKGNAIYSPYSIHSALTMTSLGARGDTEAEFTKSLGLTSLTASSAHQAYHDLIIQMNSAADVKLNTANGVFVNPNYAIEAQFIQDVKADYLASVANFDLAAAGGPEKAINDFVNENTKGMIKEALAKGSIDGRTAMILINTIFFNGTWENKFSVSKTKKQDFLQLGGSKTQVDMMYDERSVNIRRGVNGVDVAELPFQGNRFALYIALPQKTDGIADLETVLNTPGSVDQLFEGLSPVRVKLSIPKFKIESNFQLNSALQQLGIKKAFDPMNANFQGISRADHLYINEVIHKAVIEVKETGTVAAAATVVGIVPLIVIQPPNDSFVADHPFVFFLRDNHTKQILFQGKFSG